MNPPILINLFSFTPKSATGVFVYVDNLVRQLVRINEKQTYFIAVRDDMHRYLEDMLGDCDNVDYIAFGKYSLLLQRIGARLLRNRNILESAVRQRLQNEIDRHGVRVAFFPSGALFPGGLKNISTVVTLYDIQHEYLPENFSRKHLKRRSEDNRTAARNADHILAISEFTKRTIVEKYGVQKEKIAVTHLAARDFGEAESISLPQKYICYPAAIWSHKNHLILLEAVGIIKAKFPDLNIVFTGSVKSAQVFDAINSEAIRMNISDRVHYLGHVQSGVLRTIYEHATGLVFPSAFEGFGIPLVEAFSFGTPLIAANNTSITEVVGDAGILVPTGDAKALAEAINRVLTDQKLRSELIEKGHKRSKFFSWDKTARETLAVFDKALRA